MAKDGQEVKRRGRKIFAALRRHGDEAPSEEVAPEPPSPPVAEPGDDIVIQHSDVEAVEVDVVEVDVEEPEPEDDSGDDGVDVTGGDVTGGDEDAEVRRRP